MTFCVMIFHKFPPFVRNNVILDGLTNEMLINQLMYQLMLYRYHILLRGQVENNVDPKQMMSTDVLAVNDKLKNDSLY